MLGHAPIYFWPITILCLAYLCLRLRAAALESSPGKSGFGQGFWFGLGYFLFGLFWIGSAFLARGGVLIWLMPPAILALCMFLALFWGVAGAIFCKYYRSGWREIFLFTACLFIAEYLRGHILTGFPWNLPGYIIPGGTALSQSASVIGVYGISWFILFTAGSIAALRADSLKSALPSGICGALFFSAYNFGTVRLASDAPEYVPGVLMRIVHANIDQRDKFDPAKDLENARKYLNLTFGPGFEDVTHVIWPEGAVPNLFVANAELLYAIHELANGLTDTPPILIGQGTRIEERSNERPDQFYSSAAAIVFEKDWPPRITDFYDKRKLVPFGEYLPGGIYADRLGIMPISTAQNFFTPGDKDGKVPLLPGLPAVSLQICYEIIFAGFTPPAVSTGGPAPKWILNLSNDAWYGRSAGPYQHVNQVRYRAIEEGLPVVRSTSGGISGVIDSYGRQSVSTKLNDNKVLDIQLPAHVQKTTYNPWFQHILALLNILLILRCAIESRIGKSGV